MRKTFKQKMKDLQDIINVQDSHGNWDYSPYMWGLLNGLIIARSLMTGSEPVFRDKPEKWLEDRTLIQKIKYWWLVKTSRAISQAIKEANQLNIKE
jgi:predicted Ser/Thr protein kinase